MDLSQLTVPVVITFLLILCRIGGLFVSAPLLNHSSMPLQTKLGISLALTLILFPIHSMSKVYVAPQDLVQFSMMAAQELMIGLLIGFCANLILTGVRMAGDLISTQQGLSVATVLDPINHSQSPIISQFYYQLAILLFLNLNFHHALILAVHHSFDLVPLGQAISHLGPLMDHFTILLSNMFILMVMLGIPVIGVLLVFDVIMAFMAKVMPQMNIFIVAMPFKVALGLILILISLPASSQYLGEQYSTWAQNIIGLLQG